MCSIAGARKSAEVDVMLNLMKHRAPDGMGIFEMSEFTLGMGRLAIIDLKSEGLCPYHYLGYTLCFNGEIYNYIELREELMDLGWHFDTQSDIEVCLKSYLEWGADCLNKFNGMFALAIGNGDSVFLARDIAGEKPLYYTTRPFRFASENKALNFKGKELPPAHYMFYKDGKIIINQYWQPRFVEITDPEKQLEELLEDSINLRTRSDVPYGLYFSGGVDSSLISTYHNFKYQFTYKDADYAEEFKDVFPTILYHLDGPIESFTPFGLWKLAEEASKKVKVVLSGEGADELFGGYIRYVGPHFNYMAQRQYPSYAGMFQPAKNVHESGWEEFNGNMRELLRMGDRMASAFGIENRCPFLDKRIIEFAFSLPMELKINGLDTKVILNRILKRRKPRYKSIEKKGLYCSVNKWIGSKEVFGKHDYLAYQKEIWKKFR